MGAMGTSYQMDKHSELAKELQAGDTNTPNNTTFIGKFSAEVNAVTVGIMTPAAVRN